MKTATLLKSVLIMALTAGLMGCGGEDKKRTGISRNGRVSIDNNRSRNSDDFKNSDYWPGSFIGEPQHLFQEATEGFMSAVMDPAEQGEVSGREQDRTGVRFDGRIELSGGFDRNNLGRNSTEITSASLKILIWGENADAGRVKGFETLPFSKIKRGSYVDGNTAELTFYDTYKDESGKEHVIGEITLEGTIDSQWFQGFVWYENFTHHNGGSPQSWDWGSFFIPVCDMFVCK